MSTLPDIVREPKIVSGKEQIPYVKEHLLAMASGLAATYFDPPGSESGEFKTSSENGPKVIVKKKLSSSSVMADKSSYFPNLIMNDKNRSTSYHRTARSSDFLSVKNSPTATRLIYNWKPVERQTTNQVQSKIKVYKPLKRIDQPARAPSPFKIKTDYETVEPHFHNEKRALEMKRLQYQKEHTGWSIYPYAAVDEKEYYNKRIRDTLKEQIDQKNRSIKNEFDNNLLEIKYVIEQDQNTVVEDRRKRAEKLKYLTTFRNENKQLMQDRWMHDYISKRHEWQQESVLLEQDPINWSKTLK